MHHVFTVQPGVKSSSNQINADCQFESMTYQLDTIVKATEQGADRVKASTSKSGEMVDQIRNNSSIDLINALAGKKSKNNTTAF